MTVSQLRDRMTEKVVPEKLMPQNIVEFLMDEDAELPELDAFTFLNRLRALGIGSADFLYLLSGCGAPAEAVDKVRKNPAMNLQALILTLDGAGLTSQDYTRMLYTARQLWERTLTMRLEDDISDGEYSGEAGDDGYSVEDPASEGIGLTDIPCEEESKHISEEQEEYEEYSPAADEVSAQAEDSAELSETAENLSETDSGQGIFADASEAAEVNPETAAEDNVEDNTDNAEDIAEETSDNSAESDLPPEEVSPEADEDFSPEETSEFRPIDMEELRRNLISDAEKLSDDAVPEEAEEESDDDICGDEDDGQYSRGALITSVVGAAAVFAAAICVGSMGFEPVEAVSTHFAADSDEIFAAIYESYNSGRIGAEIDCWDGSASVFGNKIAVSDGSLGLFYSGGMLYTAAPEGISCGKADGAEISDETVIEPPQDTQFVFAELGGEALYAVFSGAECGFVRIDGGKVTYTAEQDGTLTDLVFGEEKISLGSVYTPPFSESFSSSQTDRFMPSLGTGGKALVPSENILMSGVSGCSYAVSAEYSLADGSADNVTAALGYPLYASAEGSSAMTDGDEGILLHIEKTDEGLSHTAVRTDGFTAAAGRSGFFAAVGNDGEGSVVTVYDSRYHPAAVLRNFDREVTFLRRSNDMVFIGGSDGVFMAADCSDAAAPSVISEVIHGKIIGNCVMSAEKTNDGAVFRAYTWDGGSCDYTKQLGAEAAQTLVIGSADAFYANNGVYGAAYSWFDGVSVVSEYALFGNAGGEFTLFDDRTGFTAAFDRDGQLCLVHGGGKISSDIHA